MHELLALKYIDLNLATALQVILLGFIGGTDNHNGSPGNVAEDNYRVGSHGLTDRAAEAPSAVATMSLPHLE